MIDKIMNFKQWLESMELMALRSHLKNPSLDIAGQVHDFVTWDGHEEVLYRLGIDPEAFREAMEEYNDDFYKMCDKISKGMSQYEQDDFLSHLNQYNPGDVPTHTLMDLQTQKGRKGYLPPTTWLIHFTNTAEEVASDGLTQGQGDIDKLALTVHQSKSDKQYGGYNFASTADGRHAQQAARNGKYGHDAVMFQASGVPVYHYSDEEDQVVVWGKDVPASRMVLLANEDGEWLVRSRKGSRDPFKGEFRTVVAWVMKNYNQYRKVL